MGGQRRRRRALPRNAVPRRARAVLVRPVPAARGVGREAGRGAIPRPRARRCASSVPDRKKKTPARPRRCFWSGRRAPRRPGRAPSRRAERASRLRNGGDPAKPRPTAAEKETRAARAAERAAEQLEARHRRAEETREARIANLVKKASEETRKIEEIALLHSLDTANKYAALREKLAEAEKRRASVAEARRRRRGGGGRGARRRGAPRRRGDAQAPAAWRSASAKELRRDALARAAARGGAHRRRDEEAAEKLAEREARERRAKTEADERRAETRRRLLAADARRRAYLNLVRERAVELDARAGGRGEGKAREGKTGVAVASPRRRVRSTPAGAAALESPSRPSRGGG